MDNEDQPTPLSRSQSINNTDLGLFEGLELGKGKISNDGTIELNEKKMAVLQGRDKKFHGICKKDRIKRSYKRSNTVKESNKNRIAKLQERIKELQSELQNTQKQYDSCPNCLFNLKQTEEQLKNHFFTDYDEEMKKVTNHMQSSRNSRQSLQFEKIDFNLPSTFNRDLDDKAWIYLGTLMIIMGSKCLDVDGTIDVFKVMKESVDNLRRQVDKSLPTITMDFFLGKQAMQENSINEEIGFDPFTQKQDSNGLLLEGVKIESVEQFELVYDNKVTFNLKYEALISSMEFVRNNCWLSF